MIAFYDISFADHEIFGPNGMIGKCDPTVYMPIIISAVALLSFQRYIALNKYCYNQISIDILIR